MRHYLLICTFLISFEQVYGQVFIEDLEESTTGNKIGLINSLQIDFIPNNFSEFESVLGSYNTSLMNSSAGIISWEIGGTYRRYYFGMNFGYAYDEKDTHDSLDLEFNINQYGLHFGYTIVDTKRFLVTPKISFKWNRYQLINNNKDRKIPIQKYISDRDLDLRFNQMTGFVGVGASYKIYDFFLLHSDYWTLGFYGGYIFKLNDKPWIYSKRNRLESEGKIAMKNYGFGMHLTFNIDGNSHKVQKETISHQ